MYTVFILLLCVCVGTSDSVLSCQHVCECDSEACVCCSVVVSDWKAKNKKKTSFESDSAQRRESVKKKKKKKPGDLLLLRTGSCTPCEVHLISPNFALV